MVKVIVLSSKCESTRLVIDPNDIFLVGIVSVPEGIQNCDNVILKSCKIVLLTITGLSIHFVIHYVKNYHFLLIQNVIKRSKEGKSTPPEYSGKIMICTSYLFCN